MSRLVDKYVLVEVEPICMMSGLHVFNEIKISSGFSKNLYLFVKVLHKPLTIMSFLV